MDFRITEEQELMVQAIEEAMTRENLEPYFQDCDKNHTHPEKWWEILKELGCFSMFLPEEAEGEDGEPGGGEGAVTMFLVMEALGRCGAPIVVTDLVDCLSHDRRNIQLCLCGNLSGYQYKSGTACRLTSHTAHWILCHARIQNRIRNCIADFVRMSFCDGLRCK